MKSNRSVITLGLVERVEVEKGVFENSITEQNVKAQFLQVYQRRINQALVDGLKINFRLRVRGDISHELQYVIISSIKYKVNSIYRDINSHHIELEIGEQM